jgi:DNA-binding XRE family transcriptional regulator
MSQTALASKCGLTRNTIYNWIHRDILPPIEIAFSLAAALSTTLEYLYYGNDDHALSPDTLALAVKLEKLPAKKKKLAEALLKLVVES